MSNKFYQQTPNRPVPPPPPPPPYPVQVDVPLVELNSISREKIKYFVGGCLFTALLVLLILSVILNSD